MEQECCEPDQVGVVVVTFGKEHPLAINFIIRSLMYTPRSNGTEVLRTRPI